MARKECTAGTIGDLTACVAKFLFLLQPREALEQSGGALEQRLLLQLQQSAVQESLFWKEEADSSLLVFRRHWLALHDLGHSRSTERE